eukprot:2645502-Amphidinium_carterae.2
MQRVGVKRKGLHSWVLLVDEARLATLSSWEKLLLDASGPRSIDRWAAVARGCRGIGLAMDTLGDTVADKATETLRVRALDVGRFVTWSMAQSISMNPILESTGYTYLKWMQDQSAAPSAGQRFKEALAFVHHVFGWNVERTP